MKVDVLNNVTTTYTYDVSDPDLYLSQGNRLMAEVTVDSGFTAEERWYTYDLIGNVTMVIRRIGGDLDPQGAQWYRGTRLACAKSGKLWISRSERWQLNGDDQGTSLRHFLRQQPLCSSSCVNSRSRQ